MAETVPVARKTHARTNMKYSEQYRGRINSDAVGAKTNIYNTCKLAWFAGSWVYELICEFIKSNLFSPLPADTGAT